MSCNGRCIHVLLVEDNPADARLIQESLRDANGLTFEILHRDTLAAGVQVADSGVIDVVLLDLSLPDSSGAETFRTLTDRAPTLPVIVLTHLDDEDVAVRIVQEGAQDYLVKGQIDGRLLARAIRYAIERKRIKQELATYAADLHTRNAQMEADLRMAREIQQAFLPQQLPVFPPASAPEDAVLRFSHFYQPCSAVGGDFFDVLALGDARAGVLVCDVMGHGMRAALVTAIIRGLVEELRDSAADPGLLLTQLNEGLCAIFRNTDLVTFATAVYLVVDADQQSARYACAGHPSPLWIRRSHGTVSSLPLDARSRGPALNLYGASAFATSQTEFGPGDEIVLFTDGLSEVEGPDGVCYGIDRLEADASSNAALRGPEFLASLVASARGFSQAGEFADDVCLVGVATAETG